MGIVASALLVVGMILFLREIERWLHQHIFKVGWLLARNYQTTTILYYTFFLPGIVLHEVILWLVAGILDVRADRAIQWPEQQEIGQLRLNFVQIDKNAGVFKRSLISAAPLITGLVIIWVIANNVFNIDAVLVTMSGGSLAAVGEGIQQLTGAVDFWLWFYIAFTIANTMFPENVSNLRGFWIIGGVVGGLIAALFIVGVGNELFDVVALPLTNALNSITVLFGLIIGMNIFATAFLGAVESLTERATGHSATFKNGKMITMTRAEALEARNREREKQRQPRRRAALPRETGPTTVYNLDFPIPGSPTQEPVTQITSAVLGMEEGKPGIPGGRLPAANVIAGSTSDTDRKPDGDSETPDRPEPRIRIPGALGRSSEGSQPPQRPPESPAARMPSGESSESKPERPAASLSPGGPSRTSLLGRPSSEKDTDGEETRARPPGLSRPPLSTRPPAFGSGSDLDDKDDDDDDDESAESGVGSRLSGLSRPAGPTGVTRLPVSSDDDDDEEDESATSGLGSRLSGLSRPASRPTGAIRPPVSSDDDEDDDDEEDKSAASGLGSRLSGLSRPASRPTGVTRPPVSLDDDDEDEDDESVLSSGLGSRLSGLSRPTSRPTGVTRPPVSLDDDDEDEDDESALSSRLSGLSRPASRPTGVTRPPVSSDDDDEDEDDESALGSSGLGSRLSGLSRPASRPTGVTRPPVSSDDDEDDDDESALSSNLGSRLSGLSRPVSRPTGVTRPPVSSDDDHDDESILGRTGLSSRLSGLSRQSKSTQDKGVSDLDRAWAGMFSDDADEDDEDDDDITYEDIDDFT